MIANMAMRLFLLAWMISGLTACAKPPQMEWRALLDEAGIP